jgi:hypothetical protein
MGNRVTTRQIWIPFSTSKSLYTYIFYNPSFIMFITPVQLTDLLPVSYLQVCNLLSSLCQFFGRTNYSASSLPQPRRPPALQQPKDAIK